MPEKTHNAVFTEVLAIEADAKRFRESLAEISKIYNEFITGLNSAGAQTAGLSGMQQQINLLGKSFRAGLDDVMHLVSEVGDVQRKQAEKTDAMYEAHSKRQRRRRQDEHDDAMKKAREEGKAASESMRLTEAERRKRTADLKAWVSGFQRLQSSLIRRTPGEVVDRKAIEAFDEQAAKVERLNKGLADTDRRLRQLSVTRAGKDLAQRISLLQAELVKVNAEMAVLEKRWNFLGRASAGKRVVAATDAEIKAQREMNDLIAYQTKLTGQLSSAIAQKQQVSLRQQASTLRRSPSEMVDKKAIEAFDEQAVKVERLNKGLADTERRMRQLSVLRAGRDLAQQIQLIQAELAKVNAEVALLEKRWNFIGRARAGQRVVATSDAEIKAQQQMNDLIAYQTKLTGQLNNVIAQKQRTSAGFFALFNSGLLKAIAGLTRFYIIINLVIMAYRAFTAVITAPFKLLGVGVQYLTEMQARADDLMGPMLANMKFSEDIAENFKKTRDAARDVAKEIREMSLHTGIDDERLTSTYKALLQAGAMRGTNTPHEGVDLATMFQMSLKAAGIGDLAAQGSIDAVTKMFTGLVKETDKWLVHLKMAPAEWYKIREEGYKHKDLLLRLMERLSPYVKQVELMQKSFGIQFTIFKDMLQQIAGHGAEELFETLGQALYRLNQWLRENKALIAGWVKQWASGITQVIVVIAQFLDKLGLLTVAAYGLKSLAVVIFAMKEGFLSAAQSAQLFVEVLKAGFTDGTVKQAFEQYRKFQEDQQKRAKEFWDLLNGKYTPKDDTGSQSPWEGKGRMPDNMPAEAWAKQLGLAKEQLFKDIEDIREEYERLRADIELSVRANTKTHAEALSEVAGLVAEEKALIDEKVAAYKKVEARLRRLIISDPELSAEQARGKETDLERDLIALQNRINKLKRAGNDILDSKRREAVTEQEQWEDLWFKHRMARKEAEIDFERDLVQQAQDDQRLTQVEALDAEQIIEERAHLNRMEMLEYEKQRYGFLTNERTEVIQKLIQEEQKYTQYTELFARRREQAVEEEARRRKAFAAEMRAAVFEGESIISALGTEVGGNAFNSSADTLLRKRMENLDLLEEERRRLYEVAAAKNAESEETRELILELQGLQNERLRLFRERVQEARSSTDNPAIQRSRISRITADEQRTLQEQANTAYAALVQFMKTSSGGFDTPEAAENAQRKLKQLEDEFERAAIRLKNFGVVVEEVQPSFGKVFDALLDQFAGFDVKAEFDAAATGVEKLAVGANVAAGVLANLGSIVDTYKAGASKGGVMGGIGAVMGQFAGALSGIPVIGQFLPAISGVLTFVGSMFTRAAKRIADEVKKQFDATMKDYQRGNRSLVDTISALERQRNQAIVRLSGKKGGKDELNKLLPEFDDQIYELRTKQRQVIEDFNSALTDLQRHSDVLTQVNQQWRDINARVREYIGAGGDARKAIEYLNLQLEKIQKDAFSELGKAEQDAVQDAIQLNDLLKQRQKIYDDMAEFAEEMDRTMRDLADRERELVEDFAKAEFDLINEDAIERRQAGSVTRGRRLEELRTEHQQRMQELEEEREEIKKQAEERQKAADEQLENLNREIQLTQQKVAMQREVFDIASDISELHRRDEELTLAALEVQIQKLKDLREIAKGISFDGVNFSANSSVLNQPPAISIGTISFTVPPPPPGANYDPREFGTQMGDAFTDEIERRRRMGRP